MPSWRLCYLLFLKGLFLKNIQLLYRNPFILWGHKMLCTLADPLSSIIVNLTCLLDFYALVYQLEINCPKMHERIKWADAFCSARVGKVVCETVTFQLSHLQLMDHWDVKSFLWKPICYLVVSLSKSTVQLPPHNFTGGLIHFVKLLLRFTKRTGLRY